ncbi:MAG: YceI family protein [Candidatus Omnitrophica bacterium]|nr:YceI family protein [Candidatus Omnitrophota bacterium]
MLKVNPSNAECSVLTFKDGLLSAVAHDLKIKVSKFEIATRLSVSGNDMSEWDISIKAVFDAASLKTVSAMKGGKEFNGALSASDRADIEKNIAVSVLKSDEFPKIRFSSSDVSGDLNTLRIKGKLTLCGVTRTIGFSAVRQKSNYVAEVDLDQRDFGIKPFSALMGTMKVKPVIKVRLSFPFGG